MLGYCGFSAALTAQTTPLYLRSRTKLYRGFQPRCVICYCPAGSLLTASAHFGLECKHRLQLLMCTHCVKQAVERGNIRSALHRELRGKKLLIVLDDVWDSKVVRAFQFPGFPGKLLVTTRDANLLATSAEVVEIHSSDCANIAEPLLARLAFRCTPEAFRLPADFQVSWEIVRKWFSSSTLSWSAYCLHWQGE